MSLYKLNRAAVIKNEIVTLSAGTMQESSGALYASIEQETGLATGWKGVGFIPRCAMQRDLRQLPLQRARQQHRARPSGAIPSGWCGVFDV